MLKIWYCDDKELLEGSPELLEGAPELLEDAPELLEDAPLYFDNVWEDDWIIDPLVRQMIKDVDKSEVIGPHLIESPILGPIPPSILSGGVKVLILALKDNSFFYNASNCGDNCAKWFLEIAKEKEKQGDDLVVYLEHIMHFSGDFEIEIINSGKIVRNQREYVDELLRVSGVLD